jgi:hypothetical protein
MGENMLIIPEQFHMQHNLHCIYKDFQQDGDKFISSSSLVYTGRDVNHSKVIFCEAVNIEGRQKVKSTEKSLYIQPAGVSVTVVTGTVI